MKLLPNSQNNLLENNHFMFKQELFNSRMSSKDSTQKKKCNHIIVSYKFSLEKKARFTYMNDLTTQEPKLQTD